MASPYATFYVSQMQCFSFGKKGLSESQCTVSITIKSHFGLLHNISNIMKIFIQLGSKYILIGPKYGYNITLYLIVHVF